MDKYITNENQLHELISKDRLMKVTIKYRGKTEGRLSAPAQDIPDIMEILEETSRYVKEMWY